MDIPAETSVDEGETEVAEPAADAPAPIDWSGLAERFPEFMSVMHPAAVHLPIGLWTFGALFVVIGVFAPSLRNQIPIACLVGGTVFSVGALLTGWWVAEFTYGSEWREFDWDETLVRHRWLAVVSVASGLLLSILALISQRGENRALAVFWRVGFIALALFVGLVGHLGGEIIAGDGFFEEALETWLDAS